MRVSFVHICDWPVLAPGLPSLVTVVQQAGHEVQVIDLTFTPRNRRAAVMNALTAFGPRVICFSIYDTLAREICREAKSALPEVSIIFGGHQATLFPDELLADPNIDGVCLGDGEESLVELLERLQRGLFREHLPGLRECGFDFPAEPG